MFCLVPDPYYAPLHSLSLGHRGSVSWPAPHVSHPPRGCAANLMRTTPAAAMTFTTFELVSRFLRDNLD